MYYILYITLRDGNPRQVPTGGAAGDQGLGPWHLQVPLPNVGDIVLVFGWFWVDENQGM